MTFSEIRQTGLTVFWISGYYQGVSKRQPTRKPDYEDSIYEHPEFTPVERLRHLMEEHALTQAELARRAGVAVTSLSDILNGKRRISPRIRGKFAECFGVSASFFA